MMRRRQKAPRVVRHETPGPAAAQRSRRRPRPDLPVPLELKLRPEAGAAVAAAGIVLVTGFDPFGGEDANPSWEVCKRLPKSLGGLEVATCRIPCAFRESVGAVVRAIEKHRPALVVSLGQAGGRAQLSVERIAINVDDARIPDNMGTSPVDEPIEPDGPPAYFATLPVKAMVAAMREAGVPAEVSNTAGTYVCNHLMYGVLHYLATRRVPARAGFIHMPYAESQVLDKPGAPALSLDTMAKGVAAAIAAAARTSRDLKLSEGRLD